MKFTNDTDASMTVILKNEGNQVCKVKLPSNSTVEISEPVDEVEIVEG
ncbi:MAG: hypothetical protein JW839_13305 [Candidatus Lokiarchaeota archaeon]|nr:hypothetical protein [Candidatus Lokiarchaeota archaeon]